MVVVVMAMAVAAAVALMEPNTVYNNNDKYKSSMKQSTLPNEIENWVIGVSNWVLDSSI